MPSCKNCRYFVPHKKQIAAHMRVYGHCTVPRVKIRHPDAETCLRFMPKGICVPNTDRKDDR